MVFVCWCFFWSHGRLRSLSGWQLILFALFWPKISTRIPAEQVPQHIMPHRKRYKVRNLCQCEHELSTEMLPCSKNSRVLGQKTEPGERAKVMPARHNLRSNQKDAVGNGSASQRFPVKNLLPCFIPPLLKPFGPNKSYARMRSPRPVLDGTKINAFWTFEFLQDSVVFPLNFR